jgi:hypothetical protein
MATIKINDITHREACCNGADADAYDVYDAYAERILSKRPNVNSPANPAT